MLTSKQRAVLRGQAATEPDLLLIGKNDITDMTVEELERLLDNRELVKGKVLEASSITAREAINYLSEKTGAEQVQVIGRKFVLWRKSKKLEAERKAKVQAEKNRKKAAAEKYQKAEKTGGRSSRGSRGTARGGKGKSPKLGGNRKGKFGAGR